MNEYDSNRILDAVKKIGYEKTEKYEDANCYLLNTCHIRNKAKEKVYSEIGRVKKIFRFKKKPLIIIAGCVAQAENKEMIKREPFIDLVIGPQAYHKINDTILKYVEKKRKLEETEFDADTKFEYLSKIKNKVEKVSSFLTIQEGCDKFCHFCVVPYTRGPEYSRPPSQILDEAKYLVDNGVREITLLGQNVNAYKSNGFRLSDLILSIEKLNDIKRFKSIINYYPLEYKKLEPEEKKLSKENNPPKFKVKFFDDQKNIENINCYSNEGDKWMKSNIKLIEKELTIEFREPFLPRRGRINCSINDDGKWRWFGTQFIIR